MLKLYIMPDREVAMMAWTEEASCQDVREALKPLLSDALAGAVTPDVAAALRDYVPHQTDLSAMAKKAEKALFRALYRELGPSLIFIQDSGQKRRIRTEELPEMADHALGALLMALPVTPASYAMLHDYAMATGSYGAISTIYRRYRDMQSPGESTIMAQILSSQCAGAPPSWLAR